MKKVISLFMSLIMLLGIAAGLSFTAQADTTVETATIYVTAPKPGATVDRACTGDTKGWIFWKSGGYYLNWYDVTDEKNPLLMADGAKYVAGHRYMASMVIGADTGYVLKKDGDVGISATVNDVMSYGKQYKGRLLTTAQQIDRYFNCEYIKISSVTLSGSALKTGDTLNINHFTAGSNVYVATSFKRNGEAISVGEKVTFGNYGAKILISPAEEYEFTNNVTVKYGDATFTKVAVLGKGFFFESADNLWTINCTHPSTVTKCDANNHWTECTACGEKTNVEQHDFQKQTVGTSTEYTCKKAACGYKKTVNNQVDGYRLADVEGGVEITEYIGSETNITIPETLGGKTVVGIGQGAFLFNSNKANITKITVPETVTYIGSAAFDALSSLTSINIPSRVKRIESDTFLGCSSLASITIPYGVEFIGNGAFRHDAALTEIIIPCSVKTIQNDAFGLCNGLTSVVIPDSVTYMGKAFNSCSGLKNVVIGNGLTSISETLTFAGCPIETITLPAGLTKINGNNFDEGYPKTVNFRGTETQFAAITLYNNASKIAAATKNYNYTEKFDVGQHKYSVFKTVEPICVENGYTLVMCEGCGDSFKTNEIPLTGKHNYSNGAVTKEPTCGKAGTKTYLCDMCGVAKYETVPATGKHTYGSAWVNKAATLSKDGSLGYTCKVCGNKKYSAFAKIKTVALSKTAYTYDGKVKKPGVTVKDSKGKAIATKYYKVTYASGRKSVGKYSVKITFKDRYSGSKTLTFKINPKGTALSGLTAGKKAFTAKWKKQTTQTTGYQLQYTTDKNFKKSVKTVTIAKNKTLSKAVKKLTAKKKYYVRVRTYKTVKKDKFYSGWSKAKAVTTKK